MNSAISILNTLLLSIQSLLIETTLILVVALALFQLFKNSPAVRHAVLLWALIAVGLCPMLTVAARRIGVRMPIAIPAKVLPIGVPAQHLVFHVVQGNDEAQARVSARTWRYAELLGIWMAGALFGLAQVVRGFYVMRRLQRSAFPAPTERLEAAMRRFETPFSPRLPEVRISDQVPVPMAVGCFRPIVLLPLSLLEKLDDRQLFYVLIHECAHVLRRDAMIGLYQRLLASLFWFHPLVHVTNYLLDRTREEVCDNYVLRATAPDGYSRTLLTVAESLSPLPNGWYAPTLVRSARHLENRVAGLLNKRRSTMTKLTPRKLATIAIGFLGGGLILSCFAATPMTQQDSTNSSFHSVQFELGTTYFQNGDSITIDEVRGTSDAITAGNAYEIRGTYKLASLDKALLAVNVTCGKNAKHVSVANSEYMHDASHLVVDKGEGHFTLVLAMQDEGSPHVSFYPVPSGESFAGVYFGTGDSVFRQARTHVQDSVNNTSTYKK